MKLVSFTFVLFGLISSAVAEIPSLPNWCGRFQHAAPVGHVGHAYANNECKDVDWLYPEDKRPPEARPSPVDFLQNLHCPLCFWWE